MNANELYWLYMLDSGRSEPASVDQSGDGFILRRWNPRLLRVIPNGGVRDKRGFFINWLFGLHRALVGRGFGYEACLLVTPGGDVVAECIISNASSRFAFMSKNDVQIGAVMVPANLRGNGLGKVLLRIVLLQVVGHRRAWWVCRKDNIASAKLAESCGFQRSGEVVRTVSLGIPRYVPAPPSG
jgi:hypothetical protein